MTSKQANPLLQPGNYGVLSRRTGYDRAHISRIMRGLAKPSLDAAKVIAIALGMTLTEFIEHLTLVRYSAGLTRVRTTKK
jgi:transcriptional regulator with XRE-family HTH domain